MSRIVTGPTGVVSTFRRKKMQNKTKKPFGKYNLFSNQKNNNNCINYSRAHASKSIFSPKENVVNINVKNLQLLHHNGPNLFMKSRPGNIFMNHCRIGIW